MARQRPRLLPEYQWPEWLSRAVELCGEIESHRKQGISRRKVREALLAEGWGNVPSDKTVEKWLRRFEAQATIGNPLSRGNSQFVRLLLETGTTVPVATSRSRTNGAFPQVNGFPITSEDLYAGSRGHTDRGWVYVWNPRTHKWMAWYKVSTNMTTILKCDEGCGEEARKNQLSQVESNTGPKIPRYATDEVRTRDAVIKAANRGSVPILDRGSVDSNGKRIWLVFAAEDVTTRRTRDRANLRLDSQWQTLDILDNGLKNTGDLVRLQTLREFKLPGTTDDDDEEEREPKGYIVGFSRESIDPCVVASEVLDREILDIDKLEAWEYEAVSKEIEARKRRFNGGPDVVR